MLSLGLSSIRRVLCLGAHADDIEIGCGGTLLRLAQENAGLEVRWAVYSSRPPRDTEARTSAEQFLTEVANSRIDLYDFPDRFFPTCWGPIKEAVDATAREFSPDVVFTHRRDDAHQDHRVLGELAWCAFRNHLILEYEIPKYEGDLGQPNVFVPLSRNIAHQKAQITHRAFPSQHDKPWFSVETLLALARIRGIEAAAPEKYAEGFYCRKLVL